MRAAGNSRLACLLVRLLAPVGNLLGGVIVAAAAVLIVAAVVREQRFREQRFDVHAGKRASWRSLSQNRTRRNFGVQMWTRRNSATRGVEMWRQNLPCEDGA